MRMCKLLFMIVAVISCARAMAYSIPLYTDVSVTFSAHPTSNLATNDLVTFSVSVTNNGPVPVDFVVFGGPDIFGELYQPNFEWTDCILTVTGDGAFGPFWSLEYYPAGALGTNPMAVGETRTCQFILGISASFPQAYSFTMRLSNAFTDVDPTNDQATVRLTRVVPVIPALSDWTMLLLCVVVALIGTLSAEKHFPQSGR
jgi:hypothetical protein